MKKPLAVFFTCTLFLTSCQWWDDQERQEKIPHFTQVGRIALEGGSTAAEISAYDAKTKRLFVVNAVKAAIDVINMEDPFNLVYERDISITQYGGGVNSVSVSNGLLAAAIEADVKTDPGKVVVWNTTDLSVKAVVIVGALPDMVTFTPNGKYILSANEGEPSEDYSIDPVGSVSIIRLPSFEVTTLDFSAFEGEADALKAKGFRIFGPPTSSFAQDIEPEYITVSHDSRTAWVTLQENNAVARIDIQAARIDAILPLGYLDHSLPGNEIDPSDRDNQIALNNWPVKGLYLPDGICAFQSGGQSYFITANEGDSRVRPTKDNALPPLKEGQLFNEESRVGTLNLDATAFPNAADLKNNAALGRLKVTNTMGDTDGDGDFDELYSFGTRSFTIRHGITRKIIYESGKALEVFLLENAFSRYDDSRSDDKGAEPETVVSGKIGSRTLAFIALERADALVVVDVTNPASPIFLQVLLTGDAPEGVLFIPAHESPNRKPLVVVSCEGDGTVQVFQLDGQFQLSGEENEFH